MIIQFKKSDILLIGTFLGLLLIGFSLFKEYLPQIFLAVVVGYSALLVALVVIILNRKQATTLELIQKKMARNYQQTVDFQQLLSLLKPRAPLPEMRGWAISPDLGLLLVNEVLKFKPQYIVECGSGVSTVLVSYALEKNKQGRIWSLENNQKFAQQSRRLLKLHRLSGQAIVIDAPLKKIKIGKLRLNWYAEEAFKKLPDQIDMLLVDGPPGYIHKLSRLPAIPLLKERLSKKAVVILDDARREDEQQIIILWKKLLPDWLYHYLDTDKGTALFVRKQ